MNLINRELSWLAFNERVLELAEDKNIPLLERCRFLAIFSTNLDDFYMIRVASLKAKLQAGSTKVNNAGFSPQQLMQEISAKTQIKSVIQEKAEDIDRNPKILEKKQEVGKLEIINSFEKLVQITNDKKEIELKFDLELIQNWFCKKCSK